MKRLMNKALAVSGLMAMAIVMATQTQQASACNQPACPQVGQYQEEYGGRVWSGFSYNVGGDANNSTNHPGSIRERGAISDSVGQVDITARVGNDECGNCEDRNSGVRIEGFMGQRSSSWMDTNGGNANSSVRGLGNFDGEAIVTEYRTGRNTQ